MLCQLCNQSQANVQLKLMVNGRKKDFMLCQDCFSKERQAIGGSFGPSAGFPSSFFNQFNQQPFGNMGFPGQMDEPIHEQPKKTGGNGFFDQFGRNLTQLAKAGLIDPVIGRDEEVERVIEILNRRNKNNPVLIGEPGVGKTAIAEGLALKIIEGKVPAKLLNKELYLLDVASLVANTGIRGQFEERMKQLVSELQSKKNIILFIDEIHLLVGAGSAEGSMDASNILKPALARGELQVIGATTLKEYRQIEKDAALERRFQPIHVHEPSVEAAVEILKGIQSRYEDFHEVTYSKDAIDACVQLSHRYIQDRFLPDKAIDLLDEAGSKLNLSSAGVSSKEEIDERLRKIASAKDAALKEENYEKAAELRDEEAELEKMLKYAGTANRPVVEAKHIQEIIEKKTGIPVGKLQEDEQQKLKHLDESLNGKVIGQEEAVRKVAKAIRRSRAGLKAKQRPIGSFLFAGPTGVGKTELTKRLAEELFGSKDAMIRLDMSEYMEKHSVSKLIGSPPGYVGHEEAGQLTEKVRRNPYSILLLDEIEKAHPDVQHIFLQIMEDGRLTDSQGRTVSFKDTVIIMTTNAGVGVKPIHVGFGNSGAEAESALLESLGSFFKPEFLNRFDSIIEFSILKKEDLLQIAELMVKELQENLTEQGLSFTISPEALEKLAELGHHPAFGARPLRRVIQEQLEDKIADLILDEPDTERFKAILDGGEIKVQPLPAAIELN
ncbi:ATP-dependent Clp protease ATP-binding subunit [Neobacillus piezotolerans]|uniref:ATP-dependent Clp protease ATP-binding subunit n=1 Tax=Neobacillus piezotolerans TaxID=2259171 RepID=A0A3D8GV80_9BACI|nr:ATP-dependent Clp protease ATP-binding subunit [Neobacillus piezotolerans]RDU38383.1 ATP-dependent Clp protease ATP-binding subunit [Neobacillus piezotolerans]